MKKYSLFLLILIFALGFISVSSLNAAGLATKLKGKILLQVEKNGEAWYVSPKNEKRYFLGRPADAFSLMRELGIGATNADLNKIQVAEANFGGADSDGDGLSDMIEDSFGTNKYSQDTDNDTYSDKTEIINGYNHVGPGKIALDSNFAKIHAGKIFLQVEQNGEAWYINPDDNKRYFLGRPNDAFNIMRNLGLGITDANLSQIVSSNGSEVEKYTNTNFDEEWNVYQNYISAVENKDLDKLLLLSFRPDQVDFDLNDEEQLESFWEFAQALTSIGEIAKNDISDVWKDEKQTILSSGLVEDDIGEYKTTLYYGENLGEKKLITYNVNYNYDENTHKDTDKDGLSDNDENCIMIEDIKKSNCIKTDVNNRDTDNDDWWDGVEMMAGSNPNDTNETPLNVVIDYDTYEDLTETEINSATLLTEEETIFIYDDSELFFKVLLNTDKHVGFSSGLDENEGDVEMTYYDEEGKYNRGISSYLGAGYDFIKEGNNYGEFIYLKVSSVKGNEIRIDQEDIE